MTLMRVFPLTDPVLWGDLGKREGSDSIDRPQALGERWSERTGRSAYNKLGERDGSGYTLTSLGRTYPIQ